MAKIDRRLRVMEPDAANYCWWMVRSVFAEAKWRLSVRARPMQIHINSPAHERELIAEGQAAPDFDLETDEGTRVSLSSLRGRKVVLFFYPKDNTSG